MAAGKKQAFILFALGQYYLEANKRLKGAPLEVVVSKKVFIDIVQKAHISLKKERALYRNLEELEHKKFVSYDNHSLKLTPKGQRLYERLRREYGPYLNLANVLNKFDVLRYTRAQTVFKD